LYPFGYGLSYTSFEYSNLKLSSEGFAKDGSVTVSVDLKNTGSLTGKETVQLYIRDLFASVARPVRELKDFQQVELKAGESKTLSFKITEKSIGFYDNEGKWIVEQGDFKVFVGGSSKATSEAGFRFLEK
jgi:beta-glucosidase